MMIYSNANENDGIRAEVHNHDSGGYSVILRDLDADEVVPVAFIYKNIDAAKAKADDIAG